MPHNLTIPMSDSADSITLEDVAPTVLPDAFLDSTCMREASRFRMPSFDELPELPLYREQVIAYVESVLSPLNQGIDGSWLTSSMINNYVKTGLLAPPVKKMYTREHIARLLVICVFKQVLSISAIQQLLSIQKMTYPDMVAYDYTAREITQSVQGMFCEMPHSNADSAQHVTRESLLIRSTAIAFASKMFLMHYLSYSGMPVG